MKTLAITQKQISCGLALALGTLCACDRSAASQKLQVEEESLRARGLEMNAKSEWASRPGKAVLEQSLQRSLTTPVHQFSLAMPSDWSRPEAAKLGFDEAQVERFVVRLPSGNQDSVTEPGPQKSAYLNYQYPEQGTVVSSMCTQSPQGQTRGPKVHYCLKKVYTVGDAASAIPSTVSRFGDEAELRPLVSPERVVPGSDLPVMAYLGGERALGVPVYAFGPQGQRLRALTGASGVADLRIDGHGLWRVRVAALREGVQMVAELEFSNDKGGR